ncbi:hypothetical protein SAMN05444374_10254 [Rhodococcoides kroppenstedtii]|uniref:Uncharacterized protein n=1 Tax=Rhodococcoides kroppenstedtii TaxID=293050 RepID=A0A1I0SP49_9NOCA|nr:hypothetical protein SAMN05444374_10254 [Rhodococcus kroppenstedtii]
MIRNKSHSYDVPEHANRINSIFETIEDLLAEAQSLGCSNQRFQLSLRHWLGKFSRERRMK